MVFEGAEGGEHTACAVEQTIAGLDGVVDLVGAGVVVDFPKSEVVR